MPGGIIQHKTRIWRGNQDFNGSFWVIGDFVVMNNVRQSPHHLIEMHDKMLAQNLRMVFAALWASTDKDK